MKIVNCDEFDGDFTIGMMVSAIAAVTILMTIMILMIIMTMIIMIGLMI